MEKRYDMSELEIRLKSLEELLSHSVEKLSTESVLEESAAAVETLEAEYQQWKREFQA
jgi:hypothetical protein